MARQARVLPLRPTAMTRRSPPAGIKRISDFEPDRAPARAGPAHRVPRFRTIQVCLKDLRVLWRQLKRTVSWHSGFRRGAHGPRDKAPIDHAARRRSSRMADRGGRAAAGAAGDWLPRRYIA